MSPSFNKYSLQFTLDSWGPQFLMVMNNKFMTMARLKPMSPLSHLLHEIRLILIPSGLFRQGRGLNPWTLSPSLKWDWVGYANKWPILAILPRLKPMNYEISKKCSIFGSSVQILGWMPPSFDGYSLQFTLDSWAPPFDEEWGMNVHSGATISFSCLGPQFYIQFVYEAKLLFLLHSRFKLWVVKAGLDNIVASQTCPTIEFPIK